MALTSYPRIEEYMSSPVVVVRPEDTLAHVRNLMIRHRIGRLVVIDESQRPIGVVTKSDFVKLASMGLSGRPLDAIPVRDVMSERPVVVEAGRSLREAARLMLQHGFGGLPVVDREGRLVGVITKSDVVKAYAERLKGKYKVSEFMHKDVPRVSPCHSIAYVVEKLEEHPCHRVLVVDGGRLVGIIAPSDIAFASKPLAPQKGKPKTVRRFVELPKGRLGPVYSYNMVTAGDVMTPDPVTVGPEEDLAEAARLMIEKGISSVPVVSGDGEPLGLVDKHSVLRAVVED